VPIGPRLSASTIAGSVRTSLYLQVHTRAIPVTESTAFNVSVAVGAVGVFTCVLAIVLYAAFHGISYY
jgi:hypothetical protein